MQVNLEDLNTPKNVGNIGTEFEVKSTTGQHMGRFFVNKKGVVWFNGKEVSGKTIAWEDLIEYIKKNGK